MVSILTILISGCVDNGTGPTSTPAPTETRVKEPIETPVQTAIVSTQTIGNSANDGATKITLNGVSYAKEINNTKVEKGNQFVIINVTVENIGKDKDISYAWPQFTLISSGAREGMPNDIDESASVQLTKPFNGEDMRPGDKRQGELAFQIPEDAKDLRLRFEYSSISPVSSISSAEPRLEIFKLNK